MRFICSFFSCLLLQTINHFSKCSLNQVCIKTKELHSIKVMIQKWEVHFYLTPFISPCHDCFLQSWASHPGSDPTQTCFRHSRMAAAAAASGPFSPGYRGNWANGTKMAWLFALLLLRHGITNNGTWCRGRGRVCVCVASP